jgi:hypothetical protein
MSVEVYNGSDLFMFIDSEPVGHALGYTLSVKMSTRGTSDKETGIYNTKAPGRFDVTATCNGFLAYGSYEAITAKMAARLPVHCVFGEKADVGDSYASGDTASYASGYFYITSWDGEATDETTATYALGFEHCCGFSFISGV